MHIGSLFLCKLIRRKRTYTQKKGVKNVTKKPKRSKANLINKTDSLHEGRDELFMDEDRMVNEGLARGYVTNKESGYIEESTVDTMEKFDN